MMSCKFNLSVQQQNNILSSDLEIRERSVLWVCGHVKLSILQLLILNRYFMDIHLWCNHLLLLCNDPEEDKDSQLSMKYTIRTCTLDKKKKKNF